METPGDAVETLLEKVEAYGKTTYELSKLRILETTTNVATTLVSKLSVVVMATMFALFVNIGLSIWIGEAIGKIYLGFLIVSGFYLLVAIIFHYNMKKWIKKPMSEMIITQALD